MTLKNQSILVTGGNGFLGSFVLDQLKAQGATAVAAPTSQEFDLRDPAQIEACFQKFKPQVVIHLAAVVGGIGANRKHPGSFFYDNAIMGINLLEKCRTHGVEKTTVLGTICAYPKHTPVPFKESAIWEGYPEETNAPYGLAKKMLLVQAQAYREEYGCNMVFLLPVNLYGPRDNFDPETSHVIPALIKKVVDAREAGADHIVCWGAGKATREFLYVEDCASGIIKATAKYDGADPVNLGSGKEISIKDLVELVVEEVGYPVEIRWDTEKPEGQPRRCLDTQRATEYFDFTAQTSFRDGLRKTIAWYEAHSASI